MTKLNHSDWTTGSSCNRCW